MSVQVTVALPDEILNAETGEASREILEQFTLEGYKSGQLTAAQVRRILGFSTRMEVDGFLKEHGVYLEYTLEDIEREQKALDKLLSK
jgi:predicted HTH domain antitoxin